MYSTIQYFLKNFLIYILFVKKSKHRKDNCDKNQNCKFIH